MNKKNYDYEKIETLRSKNVSWEDIAVEIGASKEAIRSAYRRFLDANKLPEEKTIFGYCLSCSKELYIKNKKFCDAKCQNDYKYKEWVIRWKKGLETGTKGEYGISGYLKRYLFNKHNSKCSKCGWGETNPTSNTIPLEVEHIDGNFENNLEENLTLLCPNCHSLTPTYKGANKGNGRKERKKYYE